MKTKSPTVVAMQMHCKRAFYLWKEAGKPGNDHPTSAAKKLAKTELWQQVRSEEAISAARLGNRIVDEHSSNPTTFYKLIAQQCKCLSSDTSRLVYDGNVYEGPQKTCQGFARYFQDLGEPKVSSSFYEDHRVNVEADVAILQEKYLHQEQTTFLTISQVKCDEMKPNKLNLNLNLN